MNQRKALIGVSFLLSIIILCGCEKNQALEEPVTPKGGENSQNSYVLRSYTVTPEAVTKQAMALISILDDNSLRSAERTIESVTPISGQGLRSGDENETATPIAYLVNFSNDSGYAVLSADSRLEPVWMISKQGNLSIEEEPNNPTALMLMKQVELAYNVNRYEFIDHLEPGGGFTPVYPPVYPPRRSTHIEYGAWEHIPGEKYEALIPVVWGQSEEPYNLYIPKNLSKHAGCVTAAVAQIMAFHSYPRYYNWSEMLKHHPLSAPNRDYPNAYRQIGQLYKDLGISLKVKYAPDGSSAYDKDVPKTFEHFGYTRKGTLSDFSFSSVQNELKRENGKGYPVYMSASDKMKVKYKYFLWWHWKDISFESGHAFVIDGISKARRLVREIEDQTGKEISRHYETIDLLHANLGWNNSRYNGYYNKSVFNTNKGPVLKSMSNSVVGTDYVYRYNFKTITGIRP